MQKLIQNKLHVPGKQKGNCWATVIACFLDKKISEVPPFELLMDTEEWISSTHDFLGLHGFEWGSLDGHCDTCEFYVVTGTTKRSDTVRHCCIYRNGKLWHDPHPDQSGLVTEEYFEYISKIEA